MATLTYQIAYWAWVKLEKDEIKSQRQGMDTHWLPIAAFLLGRPN